MAITILHADKFGVDITANGLTAPIHALTVTLHKFEISEPVIEAIKHSLHCLEMGGILGIDKSRVVKKFCHDSTGTSTKTQYVPDVNRLNEVIRQWAIEGIEFVGFVHTHPKGAEKLSTCDVNYAKQIKEFCALHEILMLLYIPDEEKFYRYVL